MMFGTGAPKFIYDKGGASEEEVLLDWIVITKDEPESLGVMQQSVINFHNTYIDNGRHWVCEYRQHLFKYDTEPEQEMTMRAKYAQEKSYHGKSVTFFRHREAPFFQDSEGTPILFIFEIIKECYLDTLDFKDCLLLRFTSVDPIDLPETIYTPPSADDVYSDENSFNTEDVL